MIHIFHGFLGSPSDFNFLQQDNVTLHDLYSMDTFPEINPIDTIIGYSMGGRIALAIADSINYHLKKIVLINAHPGLTTQDSRSNRESFETSLIERLESSQMNEFLSYWNKLPLFTFDDPIKMEDLDRYKKSSKLLHRYRLSGQKNYLPELTLNKNKVLYIIGSFDEKYMDLARDVLIPNDLNVKFIEGGHRLFQHPIELKKVLQDEDIL